MNDMTRIITGVEAPAQFSIPEFMRMVEAGVFEGSKVELIEGDIVRMSPARPRHILVQHALYNDLRDIFAGREDWQAYFELTVKLGERSLRDIDVAVARPFGINDDFIKPSTVLLAVEVSATTLDYDLTAKAEDYGAAGIPTYWVVDVEARETYVMTEPGGDGYRNRPTVPFGEPLAVPGTDRTITIA